VYVESFDGRFRDECLNEIEFLTLDEAREIIENWRLDYALISGSTITGISDAYVVSRLARAGFGSFTQTPLALRASA
jgi:hypothetical protein